MGKWLLKQSVSHSFISVLLMMTERIMHNEKKTYRIEQTQMIKNVNTLVYATYVQRSYYRTVW